MLRSPVSLVLGFDMNRHEEEMIDRLEAMPLDQARHAIAMGAFGAIGSLNHAFCSSWLAAKEASLKDEREQETLRIARRANRLAIAAVVLSVVTAIAVALMQWLFTARP